MIVATMLRGNSETMIEAALRSVVDWVDLVLLIDTGITDSSLQIARRVANKKLQLRDLTWKNDFAAARNKRFPVSFSSLKTVNRLSSTLSWET